MSGIAGTQPQGAGLANVERIVIFRALQLGDLLCTVPAIRALRQSRPGAHIVLVGLPWAKDFVRRYAAYLDEFIEFPGFPGLPEVEPNLAALPRFLTEMQRRDFDMAIQMHGSGCLVNSLVVAMGAKTNAGYFVPGEYCPDPARFMPYPNEQHEVLRHLSLAQFLGAKSKDAALEFPLTASDAPELALVLRGQPLEPGEYVCMHVGARFETRRWPTDKFAEVARSLSARGLRVVLTGSRDELGLTSKVNELTRGRCLDLAGQTTLGSLGALVAGARLVLTNDTGMSHLAAALKVPSVVLVLSSDAPRWAPLNEQLHRTLLADVPCRPCEYRVCPIGFPCADRIQPQDVIAMASRMIDASESARTLPDSSSRIPAEVTSCVDCAS